MTQSFSQSVTESSYIETTEIHEWVKDGSELKIDGTHIIQKEENETNYSLTIKKTTKTDTGEYSCEITNEHGKDTSKGKLAIKEKTEKAGFKKGLTDVDASEGEDIKFTVKLAGTPKPTVKWSKDGNDLTIDGKHVELKEEEDGETLTLIIHKSTVEDAGKYECTVTNSEGSETTSSKVTVKETVKAPSFTKELKDMSVKEGETIEFSVKFSGKPKVKWTKDDAELKIDSKHFEYKKEEAEDTLTIILNKATPEDTGKYSCIITNESGSATTSSKLTVSADVKAPSFEKGLKDVSAKEGETVTFNVKFSGKPKPTAKWMKDDVEVKIDNKHFEYKKEEAEDSLTLVLNNATQEDTGKYSCVLTNETGSATTSSKLTVSADVKAPVFEKGLKDMTAKEGETVTFNVKFSGKPKPTAKWTKDDVEVKIDNKHFEYKKEEAEDSLTLVLNNATPEDTGKYSCILTNETGSATTSSKLTVSADVQVPSFEKGLKDLSVNEGEAATFNVKFSGKPKPTAKWNKDGAELKIDGLRFALRTEEADDSLTLVLNNASKNDAGSYTCVITNSAGSETTTSKVEVKEAEKAPTFIKELKNIIATEDESVELTVTYDGNPTPTVKWEKDGTEIKADDDHYEIKTNKDTETLIINDVLESDSGKYSCTITNSAGSRTISADVNVKGTHSHKTICLVN